MLTAFSTTKAETIQLGSGSDAQIEMPLCSCWKYGLTQQIYTSSEIDKTGSYTAAKKWLVYSAAGQVIYSLNDAFGPYNPVSPESVQSQANCQLLAY